jgi:hypothetical protein
VFLSVAIAPPVLPVYAQPVCPGPDYIWTPGYWGIRCNRLLLGPGNLGISSGAGPTVDAWVLAFANGLYGWHAGYWGPHVGFYGGVNYGFGYFGVGFVGGIWSDGHFRYNTAVMHVDPAAVHNTYVSRSVIRNTTVNHASFNGPGGITARPTAGEVRAEHEHHIAPTTVQTNHVRAAGENRNNLVSVNHGRPATMATSRPAAEPANRAAVNHAETSKPQSTANRAASHPPQTRPPAVVTHPGTVSQPEANHARPAGPPAAANHPASPSHQEAAGRPAPQHNAPARTAPAQPHEEPARPPAAANHPASPTHQEAVGRPAPQHNAPARTAPAQPREEPARPPAAANNPAHHQLIRERQGDPRRNITLRQESLPLSNLRNPEGHQEAAARPAPQRTAPPAP